MAALWDMPLSIIKGYLDHAIETEKEQIAFDMWTTIYPEMVLEKLNFIGFKEYKDTIFTKKKQVPDKSVEEIEKEMSGVIAAYEKAVR